MTVRTSIDFACQDLRAGELRAWLRLHDMTQRQRTTNFVRLGKLWREDRRYVADYLTALEDKGYVKVTRKSTRKFFVAVIRRLDASSGMFLKYAEK